MHLNLPLSLHISFLKVFNLITRCSANFFTSSCPNSF
ncbi:hypothetical protein Patl1_12092 [Pistacia atlantica]|uniref:Uncharacterized protein n=1 Tax=Pistacia atlantica TaxID=434234 RepID=A0ACC1A3B8_9ROSI|nr:hypothetical protein Patl1_12092 [Pistacia atlantica]